MESEPSLIELFLYIFIACLVFIFSPIIPVAVAHFFWWVEDKFRRKHNGR